MRKTIEEQIEEIRKFIIKCGLTSCDREGVPDFDVGPFPGLIVYKPNYKGIHVEKEFPDWVHICWENNGRIDVKIILQGRGYWFEIYSETAFDAAKQIILLFAGYCQVLPKESEETTGSKKE